MREEAFQPFRLAVQAALMVSTTLLGLRLRRRQSQGNPAVFLEGLLRTMQRAVGHRDAVLFAVSFEALAQVVVAAPHRTSGGLRLH